MTDLDYFHPAVKDWFTRQFDAATDAQLQAWPSIKKHQPTLIAAPTGSGKTLAAFLAAIDDLVREGLSVGLKDNTHILYVSPLKALSNDIQKNLQQPLNGIRDSLLENGYHDVDIRAQVRTGDTPQSERQQMKKTPPHILVTTPESLYILLTSDSGRQILSTVRSVIVDEIHALAGNKRGAHLSLSLARLDALCPKPPNRVGLSATQKPIEIISNFLTGGHAQQCTIIDTGHKRQRDLAIQLTGTPLQAVMANETWAEIYDLLEQQIHQHSTTLIFVNTRRLAERAAHHLAERIGEEFVTAHHGSLSREHRLHAEQRLKAGKLKALVATASLELGIDIGDIDLVCQLGSPGSIAAFLQRVGRSGHTVGALPKGRIFPLSRDDLLESVALIDSIEQGELDTITIPDAPLDVLAQQLVAEVASREWQEEDLLNTVKSAWPYRNLQPEQFHQIVKMLSEGFTLKRGRRGAYVHHDAINQKLRARRGARLVAVLNGGAIPDQFDYDVIMQPQGQFVGTLNEDFAFESLPGDIFQLGNTSYRMLKIENGRVFVQDAHGEPPTIPFWFGEAPGRTNELSQAVSDFRTQASKQLDAGLVSTIAWLKHRYQLNDSAATQLAEYLAASKAALGTLPTQKTIVFERFLDETGDMHLVIHSPFGSRVNRAWGLALRKRFCRKFNFELQAAANEDNIVISLGATHSFPLEEVAHYLNPNNVKEILVQALLDAPMFPTHWRWNANISLAVPRNRNGKKVPAYFQRNDAEDLIALVFPDQIACFENLQGDREIPDHPLVKQTIHDCMHDIMDADGLVELLTGIKSSEIEIVCRDLNAPSPMSQEVINAKPYAFLDDTPAEERRTLAIQQQAHLSPQAAADLGRLNPDAIDRVKQQAWPEPTSADELHDALMLLGFLTQTEMHQDWQGFLQTLLTENRVVKCGINDDTSPLWIASERYFQFKVLFPDGEFTPQLNHGLNETQTLDNEKALIEIIRSRLEGLGPVSATQLAQPLAFETHQIRNALLALEQEGYVIRGLFSSLVNSDEQWCERGLLARIHRYTIQTLRNEIKPVSPAAYIRFLLNWHQLDEKRDGKDALLSIIEQLEGFPIPARSWETEILPGRLEFYLPDWLDQLCVSGRLSWMRLQKPKVTQSSRSSQSTPIRNTPICLLTRSASQYWLQTLNLQDNSDYKTVDLNANASAIRNLLIQKGASFFDDIVASTNLLRTQVEQALGELVNKGIITSDNFAGIRALVTPSNRRPKFGARRNLSSASFSIEDAGRWSIIERKSQPKEELHNLNVQVEHIARVLLKRYGVIFRKVLERESNIPTWRELLYVFRRLEARGEIRGGRFVDGFAGEQFALPDAVTALRKFREPPREEQLVSVPATDPLNLTGIITPSDRIPALAKQKVLYCNGEPIAKSSGVDVTFVKTVNQRLEWEAREYLTRARQGARAELRH